MKQVDIEVKVNPNLIGIGWDYKGEIELGDFYTDENGELTVDVRASFG